MLQTYKFLMSLYQKKQVGKKHMYKQPGWKGNPSKKTTLLLRVLQARRWCFALPLSTRAKGTTLSVTFF